MPKQTVKSTKSFTAIARSNSSVDRNNIKWHPLIPILVLFFALCSQLIYGQIRIQDSTLGNTNKADKKLIQLPLKVYIITDIELEQKGVKMNAWLTKNEFRDVVLPEINRIWKPAAIEWTLDSIEEQPAKKLPDREKAITYIQNAKRDQNGKSDPVRMPKIYAFCGKENKHSTFHNLYLFPYMGQTSQGNAAIKGNNAVVSLWTDKPSGGIRPPEKVLLKENGPFKIGSLARTSAHELGHNLGLLHPNKKTQTRFSRLMGGTKQGYNLVPEEIALARKTANERLKIIQQGGSKKKKRK